MGCSLITTAGELRVIAEYTALCCELRKLADDDWIEVQEANAVQTRHLIRRSTVLQVTELFDGPRRAASARILDAS